MLTRDSEHILRFVTDLYLHSHVRRVSGCRVLRRKFISGPCRSFFFFGFVCFLFVFLINIFVFIITFALHICWFPCLNDSVVSCFDLRLFDVRCVIF